MTHYILLARAFADYDQTTLPAIPADWTDTSYHNDVCPSFVTPVVGDQRVVVFVDYPDPNSREFPECERYTAYVVDLEGARVEGSPEALSDNFADILLFVANQC